MLCERCYGTGLVSCVVWPPDTQETGQVICPFCHCGQQSCCEGSERYGQLDNDEKS